MSTPMFPDGHRPRPRGITGDTEILSQDRPPLAPIMDGALRPQPDDREDSGPWCKVDANQSRSAGWVSIDDADGHEDAGWLEV